MSVTAYTPFKFAFATPASTICVTGATGYAAGYIVDELLAAGHTVHATAREPDSKRCDFLRALAADRGAPERLKLFAADLLRPETFRAAITGCSIVVHTAAVVKFDYAAEPFTEIIDPSVQGTKAIAKMCNDLGVKRLVVTSSVATNTQLEKHRQPQYRSKRFIEDERRLDLRSDYAPYPAEKVLSEYAAVDTFNGEVIAVMPSLIAGPMQHPDVRSSMQIFGMILRREAPMVLPMQVAVIHTRDVAAVHHGACFMPLPHGLRYRRYQVAWPGPMTTSLVDAARRMKELFPELNIPTCGMPILAVKLFAKVDKRISAFVLGELLQPAPGYDLSRLESEMGYKLRFGMDDVLKEVVASFRKFDLLV